MATRRSQRIKKGLGAPGGAESVAGVVKEKSPEPHDSAASEVVSGAAGQVGWEWEADGGWTRFDAALCDEITQSFVGKETHVVVQVSSAVKLRVEFPLMAQQNMSTGWRRDVRAVPLPEGQWEWQDEGGGWHPYAPAVQRLLGACQACGVDQWEVQAAGRCYQVQLGVKSGPAQQTNVETGVHRPVRCRAQDEVGSTVDGVASGGGDGEGGVASGGDGVASGVGEGVASGEGGVASGGGDGGGGESAAVSRSKGRSKGRSKKAPEASGSNAQENKGVAKKKGVSKQGQASGEDLDTEDTDSRVVVTIRGKVPVDYECHQKIGKAHVFCEQGVHWDATLNQTNLKNNNNKFYILQLLKDSGGNRYSVWFRWGRVGKAGQHLLTECDSDLEQAKSLFKRKFSDKTANSWESRECFEQHPGKYDLLSMDYSDSTKVKEETDTGSVEGVDGGGADSSHSPSGPVPSQLDNRLQSVIEMMCDVQAMEDTVLEMKYDAKKAPLGKLTAEQVRAGYAALKLIEECINKNDFGDALFRACDQFYTRVPHCFGMRRPPAIRTMQQIKEKIAMLETLSDIQVALKVLSEGNKEESPIDRHYHGLNCTLTPVDHEEEIFGMVEKYVRQTHAKTHSQYNLEVQEVFQVERLGEKRSFKDVGNRYLLWHGSRLSNWVGILSQGLRIAPPEAPVTGYMFGKGIYFSDMCSKSANYCFASTSKSEALALLCEVSLGHTRDLLAADNYADQLPKGKFSTKGLGKLAPDPLKNHTLPDGCIVPLGIPINTGIQNPSGYTLNYNEFIVYDSKQIKMKYLVKLKFHFT